MDSSIGASMYSGICRWNACRFTEQQGICASGHNQLHQQRQSGRAAAGQGLRAHQVVLDYPRQLLLSVGDAGSLPHSGKRLACPYVAASGHPRVEVGIDVANDGFQLDAGAKLTLARVDMLQKWSQGHPTGHEVLGLVGPANENGASRGRCFYVAGFQPAIRSV
jgi:hypothetical protein